MCSTHLSLNWKTAETEKKKSVKQANGTSRQKDHCVGWKAIKIPMALPPVPSEGTPPLPMPLLLPRSDTLCLTVFLTHRQPAEPEKEVNPLNWTSYVFPFDCYCPE